MLLAGGAPRQREDGKACIDSEDLDEGGSTGVNDPLIIHKGDESGARQTTMKIDTEQ